MHAFNIQQLLMILASLRHYHDHLVEQLDEMDEDDDNYGLVADDILYLNNLINEVDEVYEMQYQEKHGTLPK